jgi:hypothetical protein
MENFIELKEILIKGNLLIKEMLKLKELNFDFQKNKENKMEVEKEI